MYANRPKSSGWWQLPADMYFDGAERVFDRVALTFILIQSTSHRARRGSQSDIVGLHANQRLQRLADECCGFLGACQRSSPVHEGLVENDG